MSFWEIHWLLRLPQPRPESAEALALLPLILFSTEWDTLRQRVAPLASSCRNRWNLSSAAVFLLRVGTHESYSLTL